MSTLLPLAPSPLEAPLPEGTPVFLDPAAKFYDRALIAGGSPWRLLRLAGGSRAVAESWRDGGVVRAGEERFARTLVQQGLLHPRFARAVDVDDVDVIMPVRDDVASLRRLLTEFDGFHVTVVDDGSTHPMLIDECAEQFGVELVRLDQNRGPGEARNAGVRATNRPLVWFVDVDVTIDNPRDVLHRLAPQFDDPLLGAIAPRVCGGAGSTSRDRFEQRFSPLDMGPRSALVLPGGAVGYVPSACLMVRRSALGDGFDATLRVGEDVDLVWRLHDQGWLVRYVAEVIVTHRARGTWRHWWRQRVSYGESSSELAVRHGTRLAPIRTDAWTLVAWSSLLTRSPMIGWRIARLVRTTLAQRLEPTSDRPDEVANSIVRASLGRAGGPLARSVVRTYGPLVLVAALHPSGRRRLLALFALGSAWRWRHARVHLNDIPLALADDAAYGLGVWRGAWRAKSLRPLTPHLSKSSIGWRDVVGIAARDRSRLSD